MQKIEIGIIGGSGFYQMDEILNPKYLDLDTPFGKPSEKLLTGQLNGKNIVFLSRHGIGHKINPSEINYRANLYAMKQLAVKYLISVTAVGSLREELKPTDLVIPDQYFDNTFKREKTFFENGLVAHVSMANPTCRILRDMAFNEAEHLNIRTHKKGVYFNMEGPQFSSIGESLTYRKMGFSIIGMTQAVEAKLAKELEFCFLPLAFVTDYDCWHTSHDAVSVEMIIENLNKNTVNATKLLKSIISKIDKIKHKCTCQDSLKDAIITHPNTIPDKTYNRLKIIVEKYIKK